MPHRGVLTLYLPSSASGALIVGCLDLSHLIVQDLWITKRLLPSRLNPHQHWLLLRHAFLNWHAADVRLAAGRDGHVDLFGDDRIHLFSPQAYRQVSEYVSTFTLGHWFALGALESAASGFLP